VVIEHDLTVAAPAATVWSVIVDLDRYPEWNPFVVACRSTLAVGSPIAMRVRLLPFVAQPQRETVFEHRPGAYLRYGIRPLPFGALASSRSHAVEPVDATHARYLSRFELTGRLAPLVEVLLGARLRAEFDAMSAKLAERAERLHRGAAP
jgi:hypothetical protein